MVASSMSEAKVLGTLVEDGDGEGEWCCCLFLL